MIEIVNYRESQELEWLDVHASVMVDSAAWWIVLHQKPTYDQPTIDLVAMDGNCIVGFVVIEMNSDIIENLNPAGFVWEFGVHREFRGQDIGIKLIEKAHDEMKSRYGIDKSIWYSQEEKAQKYYEKLGMTEIDRHWQFSIDPGKELHAQLLKDGFNCWNLRGSATIEDYPRVKERFNIVTDDPALNPRICVGYQFIK